MCDNGEGNSQTFREATLTTPRAFAGFRHITQNELVSRPGILRCKHKIVGCLVASASRAKWQMATQWVL